jgi:hypothetical protein
VSSLAEKFAKTIERYERRFAAGPVGCWGTAGGTFDVVMGERWLFRPDGTGEIASYRAFSGLARAEPFRWRTVADRQIDVCLVEFRDDGWERVAFEFVVFEHDVGAEVVLREIQSEGFWISFAPLRFEEEG